MGVQLERTEVRCEPTKRKRKRNRWMLPPLFLPSSRVNLSFLVLVCQHHVCRFGRTYSRRCSHRRDRHLCCGYLRRVCRSGSCTAGNKKVPKGNSMSQRNVRTSAYNSAWYRTERTLMGCAGVRQGGVRQGVVGAPHQRSRVNKRLQ